MAFPADPLKIDPALRKQVAEDCDRSGNLRHKRDEVRRSQDAPSFSEREKRAVEAQVGLHNVDPHLTPAWVKATHEQGAKPRLRPSSWQRVGHPEAVCRATVIGIDPLENDEIVRVPCNTVGETAATVARLILHGFPYVHVDNDPVLEARREASSTAL